MDNAMIDVLATVITVVASVSASTASLGYWLGKKFSYIDAKFSEINKRFELIDKRFELIDKRFEEIDRRFQEIDKRFQEIDRRFELMEKRFDELSQRIGRLENAFTQFSETLIMLLESKEIFTSGEALSLRKLVRAILPYSSSKYYTKEVYERLKQLLDKDAYEYTLDDIEQMYEIADLIEKEGIESKRKDLIEYSHKLRFFALVAKVIFVYPKILGRTPAQPKQQQQAQEKKKEKSC
jgi:septal ring factor EnvC (AmiA/AmiB activator)